MWKIEKFKVLSEYYLPVSEFSAMVDSSRAIVTSP
jgi:hypothetical protein